MNNFKLLVSSCAIFLLSLYFAGCGGAEDRVPYFSNSSKSSAQQNRIDAIKSLPPGKLSIIEVDALMEHAQYTNGPDFQSEMKDFDKSDLFTHTPTGAYISSLVKGADNSNKIQAASKKVLAYIGTTPSCEKRCSESFKNAFEKNRSFLEARLSGITKSVVANEMRNAATFLPYYHGFANEFRLYQDVLRVVKSFEYLEPLVSTFPFRDFAFTDTRTNIEQFLKGWWDEYLKFVQEKGASPFPAQGVFSEGSIIGLTFFPDSIGYARNYLLSTNVNFFGNTLSPVNNTPFFFLNSTGATALNIVDPLIEKALAPYLKTTEGQFDKNKFDKVLSDLKGIFKHFMGAAGGQMAQIFVEKNVAPNASFLSWNGGVPVWFSRKDNKLIHGTDPRGKAMPTLVFWPTTEEEVKDYYLPNIVDTMQTFVEHPRELLLKFSIVGRHKYTIASELLGTRDGNLATKEFVVRDIQQARLLPAPEYFTNQSLTGVKIYTLNEISPDRLLAYNDAIFQVVRGVIDDFLYNVKSESDFKEGNYLLKEAYIATQEGAGK